MIAVVSPAYTRRMDFTAFRRYADLCHLPRSVVRTLTPEAQSSDYESGTVQLESGLWRIRTGRVTPTKPGAFVAVWRRQDGGTTAPFGADDPAVGLLVFVRESDRFGVFQFTPEHLVSLGVLSSETSPGKRGFRVYPPWYAGLNGQAARSQRAQSAAFRNLADVAQSPVRDTNAMIAGMRPGARDGEYVLVSVEDSHAAALSANGVHAYAVIREDEGATLVLMRAVADEYGLPYDVVLAWITLHVHSALDGVGLTAAVASRLADHGVACNVLAGFHHDHILVPHADGARALTLLEQLAAEAS